jgi:hypothetical protein
LQANISKIKEHLNQTSLFLAQTDKIISQYKKGEETWETQTLLITDSPEASQKETQTLTA